MEDLRLAYGNDVIAKTEKERDQVRERPSMFFGTDDVSGALNAPLELITNGADEVGARDASGRRNGDTIRIEVDEDYNITVEDNGRGVPMDINSEGKYNWDLVYNQMYASGKRGAAGQSAYGNAAGLNGVGAAITQFTSLYMKVVSRRAERVKVGSKEEIQYNEYEMNFEDGYPKGELIRRKWNPAENHTGTVVTFKTDPAVFQDTHFTIEALLYRLRRLATIAGGAHFVIKFMDIEEIDLFFEDGPTTFLEQEISDRLTKDIVGIAGSKEVSAVIKGKTEIFPVTAKAWFTFSVEKPFIEVYNNNAYMVENGKSYEGFKNGIAQVLESYAKKNGKIGNKDRITGTDVEECLSAIVSSEFRGDFASYDGQEKRAIKNDFLIGVFKQIAADQFTDWASTHSDEVNKVIEAILAAKDAKDKADAIKRGIIKKLSSGVASFKTRPAKLVDCRLKAADGNELYIVEGESAKSTTVQARNPEFQAVYPLTGKILNCDKASAEIIFKNKVILDQIQIFGCGVEIKSKYIKDLPKFDITKLNYSKIILGTDADLDGWHIQCLELAFIFTTMPSLIREGRVFIAEAPLYYIEYKSGNKKAGVYAYTEEEKNKVTAELRTKNVGKLDIHRFKGLGEMDSKQMAESTMNPATRRLTRVEWPDDVDAFEKLLHELMGDDLVARKSWIADYFELADERDKLKGDFGVGEGDNDDEEDEYVAEVIDE